MQQSFECTLCAGIRTMCFVLIYTIYNINNYILSSIIDLYPPRLTLIPFHLTNGHLYHGGRV